MTAPVGASSITIAADHGCYQNNFCATLTAWPISDPDDAYETLTISCNDPLGMTYFWGMSFTTCQASDPAGNHANIMFTVNVTLPPPTFQTTPGPVTFPATGPAGGPATFATPTASDVGGQSAPVTCDHQSGIVYPLGPTTVTCTAQIQRNDSQGTPIGGLPSATVQFTITITAQSSGGGGGGGGGGGSGGGGGGGGGSTADTTAPTVTPHNNIRANASTSHGAPVSYTVLATDPDNAAGSLAVVCSPATGAPFPLAAHAATRTSTVTCFATDAAANRSPTMSFTVTVVGAHDQLVALERQVRGGRSLASAAKTSLLATLGLADRSVVRHSRSGADTRLALFIAALRHAKVPAASKARWIGEAARIIVVLA